MYPSETIIVRTRRSRSKGNLGIPNVDDDEVSTLSDNSLHPESRQRSASYQGAYPIRSKSKLQAYLNMKKHESTELRANASNAIILTMEKSGPFQPHLPINSIKGTEGSQRESNIQDDDSKSLPSRSSIDGDGSNEDIPGQVFNRLLDSMETQLKNNEASSATNVKVNGLDANSNVIRNEGDAQTRDRLRRLKKKNIYRQMMRQRRNRAIKNEEETKAKPQSEKRATLEDTPNRCPTMKVFQTTPNLHLKEALTRSCKYDSNPPSVKTKNGATGSIADASSHTLERIKTFREKGLANQATISQHKLLSSPQSYYSIDTQTTAAMTTTTSISGSDKSTPNETTKGNISYTSFLKEWMEKVEKEYGVRPKTGAEVNDWDSQTQRYEKEVLHRVRERTRAKVCVAPFPGIQVAIKKNLKSEKDVIEDPPCLHRVSSTRLSATGKGENECEEHLGVNFVKDNNEIIRDLKLNNEPSEFEHGIASLPSEDESEGGDLSIDLSCGDNAIDKWESLDTVKSLNENKSRLEQFLSDKGQSTIQSTSYSSLADSSGTDSDLSTTSSSEFAVSVNYDNNSEGNVRSKPHIFNTFSENGNEKIEIEYRRTHSFDNKWNAIHDPECTSFHLTRKIPRSFVAAKKQAPEECHLPVQSVNANERQQHRKLLQKLQTVARKVWNPTQTDFQKPLGLDPGSANGHDHDEEFLLGNCCSIHGGRYAFDSFL